MLSSAIKRAARVGLAFALITQLFQTALGVPARAHARRVGTINVSFTRGRPINTFAPMRSLGAGIDGHEKGENALVLSPQNVEAMLTAGLKPLTYRLRTELGLEAWHWNPRGNWSDPAHERGYWTSDDHSDSPIEIGYGYRLPRRGNTIDQANDDGYSRIDDGDDATFWKSNPYLDSRFTGEPDALHPQWVVVDLGERRPVDSIRIRWAEPYATHYAVEYWEGEDAIYIDEHPPGRWLKFEGGEVRDGRGGDATLKLSRRAVNARFVRVVMDSSSHTAPAASTDVRDRLGYALGELYLGTSDASGVFRDYVYHSTSRQEQTVIYASSTDPWHRAEDIDYRIEQPGFDSVFASGLTNGLPLMIPAGVLYDTPENAAAEVRYLRARGYNVVRVEMGEEPDGQYVRPEDYSALYIQFADALHRADPNLKLGGPCFETFETDAQAWPDEKDNRSWTNRFIAYLKTRGHLEDFSFFSFEWYPFDNVCAATEPQLLRAPGMLKGVLSHLVRDGLPRGVPWLMTEYGYSAFAGRAEVDIEGALLNADIVGSFLALGGDEAYLYGYEPNVLIREVRCRRDADAWGNNMLFQMDNAGRIKYRTATYYGARMLAEEWAQPSDLRHEVYRASSNVLNGRGQALVTAYAVRRPDGQWALLLINKDRLNARPVRVRFLDVSARRLAAFGGALDLYQFSSAQYVWRADEGRGQPVRDDPPQHTSFNADSNTTFELPPYSLTVVRGRVPGF